jgi:hypothetical protein
MDKINIDEIFLYGKEDFSNIKILNDLDKFLEEFNIKIYYGYINKNIYNNLKNTYSYSRFNDGSIDYRNSHSTLTDHPFIFYTNTKLIIEVSRFTCYPNSHPKFSLITIKPNINNIEDDDIIYLYSNDDIILTDKPNYSRPYSDSNPTITKTQFTKNLRKYYDLYIPLEIYINPKIYCDYLCGINDEKILNNILFEKEELKNELENLKNSQINLQINIKKLNDEFESNISSFINEKNILKNELKDIKNKYFYEKQLLNEQIEDLKNIHNNENKILNVLIEEQIEDLEVIHNNEIQLFKEQINNLENKYSYEKNININQNKKISSIFELSDEEEIYISNEININKFTYLKLFFYLYIFFIFFIFFILFIF